MGKDTLNSQGFPLLLSFTKRGIKATSVFMTSDEYQVPDSVGRQVCKASWFCTNQHHCGAEDMNTAWMLVLVTFKAKLLQALKSIENYKALEGVGRIC